MLFKANISSQSLPQSKRLLKYCITAVKLVEEKTRNYSKPHKCVLEILTDIKSWRTECESNEEKIDEKE